MNDQQPNSGISSLVIGAFSIVVVSVARHFETFGGTGALVINTLDNLGLVRKAPPGTEMELRSSGLIFPLTDESVLSALFFYGGYLAFGAILLALWAEYRREQNLYLSAGFMCGAGGLFLASQLLGVIAVAGGSVALLVLRHRSTRAMAN